MKWISPSERSIKRRHRDCLVRGVLGGLAQRWIRGLPPKDHAVETIDALITRARQLQRSAHRLRDSGPRTTFFLSTIALEKVLWGLLIWSYAVNLSTYDGVARLLANGNRHQRRQQFAVALCQVLEVARPRLHKLTHKKPHYRGCQVD